MFCLQVPKYLAQKWEKPDGGGDVGKLRITRSKYKVCHSVVLLFVKAGRGKLEKSTLCSFLLLTAFIYKD